MKLKWIFPAHRVSAYLEYLLAEDRPVVSSYFAFCCACNRIGFTLPIEFRVLMLRELALCYVPVLDTNSQFFEAYFRSTYQRKYNPANVLRVDTQQAITFDTETSGDDAILVCSDNCRTIDPLSSVFKPDIFLGVVHGIYNYLYGITLHINDRPVMTSYKSVRSVWVGNILFDIATPVEFVSTCNQLIQWDSYHNGGALFVFLKNSPTFVSMIYKCVTYSIHPVTLRPVISMMRYQTRRGLDKGISNFRELFKVPSNLLIGPTSGNIYLIEEDVRELVRHYWD